MRRYVLDASVAAKWFLRAADETFLERALQLLACYVAGEVHLFVPDLFYAEFANILWKAERRGRCDARTNQAAVEEILKADLPTFPGRALLKLAAGIARTHDRSVYDSLYLALAVDLGATLVTADKKLARAVAGSLPVVWLGALQPADFSPGRA